jgi:GNAT superfamily N-acetyltransferase
MDPGDACQVADLTRELGYARSEGEIAEWLETCAGSQAALVACADGDVLGWVEVSLERRLQTPAFGLIGGLVVREGFRGRGIGQRLCAAAEDWVRQQGVQTIRVTSRASREAAHRFYRREGYRRVKTSEVFEKGLSG